MLDECVIVHWASVADDNQLNSHTGSLLNLYYVIVHYIQRCTCVHALWDGRLFTFLTCVCVLRDILTGLPARPAQHEPQVDRRRVMSASCCLPWTYSCCASYYCQEHRARTRYVLLVAWFTCRNAHTEWILPTLSQNVTTFKLCNFVCWISAKKFEFVISQCSVATCLRYGFCSKFVMLSSSAKILKIVKMWQRYREFKGGNFFLGGTVYLQMR